MRISTLALVAAGGITAGLATLPAPGARAALVFIPQASESTVTAQPVWYDRWGRWHPPFYRQGYASPPGYYAYGPAPRPYWRHRYWHHRQAQCLRHNWC